MAPSTSTGTGLTFLGFEAVMLLMEVEDKSRIGGRQANAVTTSIGFCVNAPMSWIVYVLVGVVVPKCS